LIEIALIIRTANDKASSSYDVLDRFGGSIGPFVRHPSQQDFSVDHIPPIFEHTCRPSTLFLVHGLAEAAVAMSGEAIDGPTMSTGANKEPAPCGKADEEDPSVSTIEGKEEEGGGGGTSRGEGGGRGSSRGAGVHVMMGGESESSASIRSGSLSTSSRNEGGTSTGSSSGGSNYSSKFGRVFGGGSVIRPSIAKQETKTVRTFRIVLIVALVASTVGVAAAVYLYTTGNERVQFEAAFQVNSIKVLEGVGRGVERTLASLDEFQNGLLTDARASNQTWPFVVIPKFGIRATKARRMGEGMYMSVHPLVKRHQRDEWENFTLENENWLNESMYVQASDEVRRAHGRAQLFLRAEPVLTFPCHFSCTTGMFRTTTASSGTCTTRTTTRFLATKTRSSRPGTAPPSCRGTRASTWTC
jgi:hypothetical protein